MATITSLTQMHGLIATWMEQNVFQSRTQQGDKSRQWAATALGLPSSGATTMTQAAFRAFVDRSGLNKQYATQYQSQNVADKKDLVCIKVEISVLYSFLKCFVERHKSRLMYYRDDLSKKGYRVMYNVKLSEQYHTQVQQELQA